MGITKVSSEEIGRAKLRSKVHEYIQREFEAIRKHLEKTPPKAGEGLKLDFKGVPAGKVSPATAVVYMRRLLRKYIQENGLGLSLVGKEEDGKKVLFIVAKDRKPKSRAA
jgi:hypothetical protein